MRRRQIVRQIFSVALGILISGCAQTMALKPITFENPDQKVLYDLMVERCSALSMNSTTRLTNIYTQESRELKWIEQEVSPILSKWPATYRIVDVKRMDIIGDDAVGRFTISVQNQMKSNSEIVDVVYEKGSLGWKIDFVVVASN